MVDLKADIAAVAKKVEAGFVFLFHTVEHELPAIFTLLVNLYGPAVVAEAVATHAAGVTAFADKEIGVASADTQALVQSTLVQKFGLPGSAAQFVASGIAHLFVIGADKVNDLIAAGAAKLEADAAPPTPPATIN